MAVAELDAVHRMAFHLARRVEDAADLVQETYLRAFKAQNTFTLDPEKGIRPWLFKILHNVFYTMVARNRRAPVLMEDLSFESDSTSESGNLPREEVDEGSGPLPDLGSLDWEQVDERLKHAIDQLPDHYRIVLLLWAVEELKYKQVAEVLDIPVGTVMNRLFRARKKLQAALLERGIRP